MRPVSPEDLYEHRIPFEVQLAPDGSTVIWSEQRVHPDRSRTFRRLVRCTPGLDPVDLTTGEHIDHGAKFSPDGSCIAFFRSDPDDEDGTKLCWIPTDGGEARVLIQAKADFGSLDWSPDGKRLVVSMRQHDELPEGQKTPLSIRVERMPYKSDGEGYLPKDTFHLYLVDLDGEICPLTEGPYDDTAPIWAPDGVRIAFFSNRRAERDLDPENGDVFVVHTTGGDPTQCTHGKGLCFGMDWSPDSRWIACNRAPGTAGEPLFATGPHVFRVDPTGHTPEVDLTPDLETSAGDLTLDDLWGLVFDSGPTVLEDAVLTPISEHGRTWLARIDLSGERSVAFHDPGVLRGYHVAGGKIAAVCTNTTRPGIVKVQELGDTVASPIAWPLESWISSVDAPEQIPLWISHPEGHRLQAWLTVPKGDGPHPLLLQIHGGPPVQFGDCWFHENHVLAGAGFAVLAVNPRGSRGYGDDFCKVIKRDWGTKPMSDLMCAVDHVLELGLGLDPDRVGVLGGSYGGYMTNWLIGHTDRFQAACTQRTVADVETLMFGDFGIALPDEVEAEPSEEPELYRFLSPISRAAHMNTPLLILQGLDDHRTPSEQGERLFVTLKRLGKPVEMVLFPGASHGLSRSGRPDQRVERLKVILEFFERRLKE